MPKTPTDRRAQAARLARRPRRPDPLPVLSPASRAGLCEVGGTLCVAPASQRPATEGGPTASNHGYESPRFGIRSGGFRCLGLRITEHPLANMVADRFQPLVADALAVVA